MSRYDNVPYEKYPDNCERCSGTSGGVRGNENRYPVEGGGYRVLCDYCSVEIDNGLDREILCLCGHPLSIHEIMRGEQIDAAREQGIGLSICSVPDKEYTPSTRILVLLDKKQNPLTRATWTT